MNKVILCGRLTADPELRQSQAGTAVCRFTVAVNRKFKNDKGEYEADFINCTAFKQTAEFVSRYFTKGKMIIVEGNLRTGSYQDKKHSDVTHYTTDVFAENVEFGGDKGNNQQPTGNYQPAQPAQNVDTSQYGNLSDFEEILSDGPTPF